MSMTTDRVNMMTGVASAALSLAPHSVYRAAMPHVARVLYARSKAHLLQTDADEEGHLIIECREGLIQQYQ